MNIDVNFCGMESDEATINPDHLSVLKNIKLSETDKLAVSYFFFPFNVDFYNCTKLYSGVQWRKNLVKNRLEIRIFAFFRNQTGEFFCFFYWLELATLVFLYNLVIFNFQFQKGITKETLDLSAVVVVLRNNFSPLQIEETLNESQMNATVVCSSPQVKRN